jgi:hypothetical protein
LAQRLAAALLDAVRVGRIEPLDEFQRQVEGRDGGSKNPAEAVTKKRLKQLLAS